MLLCVELEIIEMEFQGLVPDDLHFKLIPDFVERIAVPVEILELLWVKLELRKS